MSTHKHTHFFFLLCYDVSVVLSILMQAELKQKLYLKIIHDDREQGLLFERFPQGLMVYLHSPCLFGVWWQKRGYDCHYSMFSDFWLQDLHCIFESMESFLLQFCLSFWYSERSSAPKGIIEIMIQVWTWSNATLLMPWGFLLRLLALNGSFIFSLRFNILTLFSWGINSCMPSTPQHAKIMN